MQSDRWIALALMALAALYGLAARQFTVTAVGDPLGPSAFPLVLAFVLGIGSLLLFLRPGEAAPDLSRAEAGKIALILLSLIGFALLVEWLGFVITTTLTMVALALIFKGPLWPSVAGALLFSLSTFVLFRLALGLRLPLGSLFGF